MGLLICYLNIAGMDPVCVKGSLNPSSDQVDPRRNLWPTSRRIRVTIAVAAALWFTGAHRFALLASSGNSPVTSPAAPAPEFDWYAVCGLIASFVLGMLKFNICPG